MPVAALSALPSGARALIDANVFIYAAGGKSRDCEVFLVRCARQEVRGVTTVEVLAEVSHRRMVAEAFEDGLIPREAASYLQAKRAVVAGLRRYQAFINEILDSNLLILGLDEERFRRSGSLRSLHGLLTNDSLILAAAEATASQASPRATTISMTCRGSQFTSRETFHDQTRMDAVA